MAENRSTDDLYRLLQDNHSLEEALMAANGDISNPTPLQVLNGLLVTTGQDIPTLADEARLSRSFAYQIFEGVRKPGREALLRLAFAMRLSLADAQSLLRIMQRGELYARIRREAVLIYALEHGYTITQANDALLQNGETPLLPLEA